MTCWAIGVRAASTAGSAARTSSPSGSCQGRDVSTAQLSPEDKNAISHRGHAFRALLPYLVDALDARP